MPCILQDMRNSSRKLGNTAFCKAKFYRDRRPEQDSICLVMLIMQKRWGEMPSAFIRNFVLTNKEPGSDKALKRFQNKY